MNYKYFCIPLILFMSIFAKSPNDSSSFKYQGYVHFKADVGIGYVSVNNKALNSHLVDAQYPTLPQYLISVPVAISFGHLRWQNELQLQFNNINESYRNNKKTDISEAVFSYHLIFKEFFNAHFESSSLLGISVSNPQLEIQDSTFEKKLFSIKIGKEICFYSNNHFLKPSGHHIALRFSYNIPINPNTKMYWLKDNSIYFPVQPIPSGINIHLIYGKNFWGP